MHPNEKARTTKLAEFQVMGTGPETRFDRLSRLAGHVVESPISWICFHDSDVQWVKAMDGAELAVQSPRRETLCTRVVDAAAPLQLHDLMESDDEVERSVAGKYDVRSYSGVPIIADGFAIGVVGTLGSEPKTVDPERELMLSDIAALALTELRLRTFETASSGRGLGARPRQDDGRTDDLLRNLTREHLRVLQAIHDGIIAVNCAGEISFVNPAAERMLARPAGSLVGVPFEKIRHHAEGEEKSCPVLRTMTEGKERMIRNQSFVRGDGKVFPVEICSSPIRIGREVVGSMVICRDATAAPDLQGVKLRHALKEIEKLKEQMAKATVDRAPSLPPVNWRFLNLLPKFRRDERLGDLTERISAAEIDQIMRAMALAGHVIDGPVGAATILGMPATTLRKKLAVIEHTDPPKRISRLDRWAS